MPPCRIIALGTASLGLLLSAAPAPAPEAIARRPTLEAAVHPAPVPRTSAIPATTMPAAAFRSVKDALRAGVRDYNAGDKEGAARALEYAATQGHTLALWKLGRMYAEGDGVPNDQLKAFEYFSKIVQENADEGPDSASIGVVSSAFVALGSYFLDGIEGTLVKSNPERAFELFHYAAAYFGDSSAQFSLGRLYLHGTGIAQDPRQAARWFNLAAEKGHHQAQALLGELLTTGQGVPAERAKGLMWLTMAREAADPEKDAWIVKLHEEAFAATNESERQAAAAYGQLYLKRKR